MLSGRTGIGTGPAPSRPTAQTDYHPQDGTTDPANLESRLGGAHNELASTITQLQDTLEGLVKKLSPVIRPIPPQPADNAKTPPPPDTAYISPSVDFVRSQQRRVERLIMDVNELYQRLDT